MIIRGGTIITGDGHTIIPEAHIVIRGERIVDVGPGFGPDIEGEEAIDALNQLVIPGIINTHAHACAPGPFTPVAGPARTMEQVRIQQHRHLLGGETTVLHLCGFCLQREVDLIRDWPLRVKVGTSHLPSALKAAQTVDGRGLSGAHCACTVHQRLVEGAAVIGEIGAGHTLGGGGQDYQLIPQVIQRASGVWLGPDQARELKWAVLGKHLQREAFDRQRAEQCLRSSGLSAKLTVSEVQTLICDSVLPPLHEALRGFEEAAAASAETGSPAVIHNCPLAAPEIARLSQKYPGARLIAAHSNQADFEIHEAVQWSKRLRDLGVIVDVSTWDSPGKALHADPEKFITMIREGVVDTVSTDYAGGEWEPILKGLAMAVKAGAVSLAGAVAFATGNVARLLPEVATDRGLIAPGKMADLVLVEKEDVSRVIGVLVKGTFAARNGQIISPD